MGVVIEVIALGVVAGGIAAAVINYRRDASTHRRGRFSACVMEKEHATYTPRSNLT